ncbi:QacE family quaternary ammonium compound efflux SMR transporter [Mycolicibacterium peregrinum]|uniref:DMT family transporter n=1 Tax=Mycolicibacterium peregrinum TaxID=43304 RepID=UPI0006D82644|nr:multidrug efflux SMR transporter [Mycolicibacterium peregrinum]MCV7203576.1 multidrug efflux SMR transporter [Mycolicibacterium peregrinum]ORW59046.1 chaperone [Mycolicibacterium peregrinum]OWM08354.1 QacE family quaternary ammonium compound efflux SMR transporter [Mycolicibacterium peregrinum]
MSWVLLVFAGLLEIVWALAIKQSDGFTRLCWSVVCVVAAVASFVILAMVVRHLPVGTAYAVWAGIGAVGVTIAGVVLFSDALTPLRMTFIAMIVVGLVGLRFVES